MREKLKDAEEFIGRIQPKKLWPSRRSALLTRSLSIKQPSGIDSKKDCWLSSRSLAKVAELADAQDSGS